MINLTFAIASAPRQLRHHVTPCQRAMGYAMRHPEDRGHGRPTQAVNVGADSSMAALMVRIDGRTRGIEQVDHGTGQEDRR